MSLLGITGRRWIPLLLVGYAYLYFATCGRMSLSSLALEHKATEGYQLLTEGFTMGRLGLSIDPDPKLVAMADPYDPSTHYLVPIWDTCYYKGRFYLMHGPLPVLLFYLPVRLLTGQYANARLVMLFFGCLNFLFLYALLLRIKDQHFKGSSELVVLLGGLSIGVGNLVLANMVRDDFYFTCLTSSAGVLAVGFYALYRALEGGPLASRWMAGAALGIAAAALGRPNMALGSLLFVAVTSLWAGRELAQGRVSPTERRSLLTAIWAPSVAIGLLIAGYNFLRFGHPLEFGIRYMMTSIRMSDSGFLNLHRALQNIAFNLKVDFLQRFVVQNRFPFVRASLAPLFQVSLDPYYFEDNIGFFTLWPSAWLLILLPAALRRWLGEARFEQRAERGRLGFFVGLMGAMALLQIVLVLSLSTNTFRYQTDFASYALVLLAVTVLLLMGQGGPSRWKMLLGTFYEVGAVYGVIISVNYAFCSWHCLFAGKVPELQHFLDSLAARF